MLTSRTFKTDLMVVLCRVAQRSHPTFQSSQATAHLGSIFRQGYPLTKNTHFSSSAKLQYNNVFQLLQDQTCSTVRTVPDHQSCHSQARHKPTSRQLADWPGSLRGALDMLSTSNLRDSDRLHSPTCSTAVLIATLKTRTWCTSVRRKSYRCPRTNTSSARRVPPQIASHHRLLRCGRCP